MSDLLTWLKARHVIADALKEMLVIEPSELESIAQHNAAAITARLARTRLMVVDASKLEAFDRLLEASRSFC